MLENKFLLKQIISLYSNIKLTDTFHAFTKILKVYILLFRLSSILKVLYFHNSNQKCALLVFLITKMMLLAKTTSQKLESTDSSKNYSIWVRFVNTAMKFQEKQGKPPAYLILLNYVKNSVTVNFCFWHAIISTHFIFSA